MSKTEELFDGIATEAEVREMLVEVGLQANEHGLADFAVDTMFEEARKQLRQCQYDRAEVGQGLGRLDEDFLANLYVALTGDGTETTPEEVKEYLTSEFSDEEIENIVQSYILCLSVAETVRRLRATEAVDT